jgi:hypothetical protein
VHAFTTKESLLLRGWLKSARFFLAHSFTQIASHEQPRRPHGQPAYQRARHEVRFYVHPKKNHSGGPRNKNAHLQQANASVCGRKVSLDPFSRWYMMAIWGKQDIGAYVMEYSLTNTRTDHKRAVVSLIKAQIIFTNRTKKRNPTKPKPAKSTLLDECMAQSRRETLKYAQGTLFRLVLCSCKVLG